MLELSGGVVRLDEWLGAACGLCLCLLESHANTGRCSEREAELLVELIRLTIREQTDVGGLGYLLLDVARNFTHDSLAQTTTLVLGQNGNVCNLIETAAVANDAAHRDRLAMAKQLHAKKRIGQPSLRGLQRFWAQSGGLPQMPIGLDRRSLMQNAVG